jgi:hypothetical protein
VSRSCSQSSSFSQFQGAHDQLTRTYTIRPTDLNRLLEQTARTALLRQGEPRPLHASVHRERPAAHDSDLHRDSGCLSVASRRADHDSADWDVARALRGDVRKFNGAYTWQAVRGLRMGERMCLCAFRLARRSLYTQSRYRTILHCGVQFPFFPWKYLFLSTT